VKHMKGKTKGSKKKKKYKATVFFRQRFFQLMKNNLKFTKPASFKKSMRSAEDLAGVLLRRGSCGALQKHMPPCCCALADVLTWGHVEQHGAVLLRPSWLLAAGCCGALLEYRRGRAAVALCGGALGRAVVECRKVALAAPCPPLGASLWPPSTVRSASASAQQHAPVRLLLAASFWPPPLNRPNLLASFCLSMTPAL
jgi:hypothetical protein